MLYPNLPLLPSFQGNKNFCKKSGSFTSNRCSPLTSCKKSEKINGPITGPEKVNEPITKLEKWVTDEHMDKNVYVIPRQYLTNQKNIKIFIMEHYFRLLYKRLDPNHYIMLERKYKQSQWSRDDEKVDTYTTVKKNVRD